MIVTSADSVGLPWLNESCFFSFCVAAVPPFPKDLEVDAGCYMGMANALSYRFTRTTPREPFGVMLKIACLVVPGSGRVTTTGEAQLEYGSSCKNAIDWLSRHGGKEIEKRGMGKPRFDASTLRAQFDVGGEENKRTSYMPSHISLER